MKRVPQFVAVVVCLTGCIAESSTVRSSGPTVVAQHIQRSKERRVVVLAEPKTAGDATLWVTTATTCSVVSRSTTPLVHRKQAIISKTGWVAAGLLFVAGGYLGAKTGDGDLLRAAEVGSFYGGLVVLSSGWRAGLNTEEQQLAPRVETSAAAEETCGHVPLPGARVTALGRSGVLTLRTDAEGKVVVPVPTGPFSVLVDGEGVVVQWRAASSVPLQTMTTFMAPWVALDVDGVRRCIAVANACATGEGGPAGGVTMARAQP